MTPKETAGQWPLVITCEHATGGLPADLEPLFAAAESALGGPPHEVLQSHRGFDAGALQLAQAMGRARRSSPIVGEVSRLVVDLNRSLRHPKLFSAVTRTLPREVRQQLVARFWQPHRQRVEQAVHSSIAASGRCAHLAMHSFTPVWNHIPRTVDIGLLYDPVRSQERHLALALRKQLLQALPDLRVRFNQPYRGQSDGLPTALRRAWPCHQYVGLEIEVSQKLVHNAQAWRRTLDAIVAASARGLDTFEFHTSESF